MTVEGRAPGFLDSSFLTHIRLRPLLSHASTVCPQNEKRIEKGRDGVYHILFLGNDSKISTHPSMLNPNVTSS